MKEKITQMNEVIKLLCKERSENKEEPLNAKMGKLIESIEDMDKNRKVTEVESRNVNSVKEIQKNIRF